MSYLNFLPFKFLVLLFLTFPYSENKKMNTVGFWYLFAWSHRVIASGRVVALTDLL